MANSEYKTGYIDDTREIALVKLSKSVLGGNDALDFTTTLDDLTSNSARCIIVDASEVEIMNSTGIGMLANAHSNLTKNGFLMFIVNLPPKIMKLLTMTHLDKVFKIYKDVNSAVNEFKKI